MTKHVHMAPPQSVSDPPAPGTLRLSFLAITFLFVCAALMGFGHIGNGLYLTGIPALRLFFNGLL